MKSIQTWSMVVGLCLFASTAPVTRLAAQELSTDIRLNQIGFYPDAEKIAAVVGSSSSSFSVMTRDMSETVFSAALGAEKAWNPAQALVKLADFSDLKETGEYVLVVPDLGHSYPFEIRENVHQGVLTASIKGYYFQRASTALEDMYAGPWSRSAGHPDDHVLIHPSAASDEHPAGTVIAAPGGWYDAGDFNKYVVNSGISTGTLLMLYEHFPEYFSELETTIPESGDQVPDLLDEILWNVRWMMTMQDPADGGVYTKLTTANFEGMVMPAKATATRYVIMKSTAAALDFAAVLAIAARVYRPFDEVFPGLADSMLSAAEYAWTWARANPSIAYNQAAMNQQFDPDISTGAYGDNILSDEFRWAADELFISSKQDSFLTLYPPSQAPALTEPEWWYVDPLGYISLAFHGQDVAGVVDTAEISGALIVLADEYVDVRRASPIGATMGASSSDFVWGSNGLAANEGMILIQAYRLTDDREYLDAAVSNLDYLLGRNGTGYSFVTGYGDKTPMHPHHRQSQADKVVDPVPGLLAGGSNRNQEDGCDYPSTLPADSYVDSVCSWASNEIAINWNAPFAYLSGALEAILSPTGRPVSTGSDPELPLDQPGLPDFSISPNPASDEIHIQFTIETQSDVTIRLFDLLGREVVQTGPPETLPRGNYRRSVALDSLPPGRYAVLLQRDGDRAIRLATVVR